MIVLLGASGYVGQAFVSELRRRKLPHTPLARSQVDYSRFETLLEYLRSTRPAFVINAAGFIGKPNVDACEQAKAETLLGNTLLPLTVTHACAVLDIPWGHVSTGCIYDGAWVQRDGNNWEWEKDLTKASVRQAFMEHPERFR